MATTGFIEDAPTTTTVDVHSANPDMQNQDSHSYAGSVVNQKIQDLAAMAPTALPTVEKLWDFYDKAYSDAENFKKSQTEANLAQARQQQQKVWELTPQSQAGGLSPIQLEAAERAKVAQQAEQQKEGPSALAESARQGGAYIKAEQPAYGDKISALSVDLDGLDRLSKLHDQMTTTAPLETGGIFRSWLGHSRDVAINTDANARNYFQLADLLTPTFGKGIQGDLPAATTKANIIEMMDKNVIPNEIDNPQSAHNKWFNLYNQAVTVGLNLRAQMKTEGQDTSRINDILVDGQNWLKAHSDWDPVKSQALVQQGTSTQTNQVVNAAVNTAIGAQGQGQGQGTQTATANTVAPNRTYVAPPSWGTPQASQTTYPPIANDPGTPGPRGLLGLATERLGPELSRGGNDIMQFLQFLSPQQGGPAATAINALPPNMAAPNPLMWGR